LTVKLNALVIRVVLDNNKRATGVEFLDQAHLYRADPAAPLEGSTTAKRRTVNAKYEVILAGGAFNTPQLLMLSGIGPPDELEKHKIKVEVPLPGVGKNLQDRIEIGLVHKMDADFEILKHANLRPSDREFADWRNGHGLYTTNGVVSAIIKRSNLGQPDPDLFLFAIPGYFAGYHPGYSKKGRKKDFFTWVILKAHTHNTAGRVLFGPCNSPAPPARPDPRDPLTARRSVPNYRAALTREVRGLRVGVIRELTHGPETDPEMRAAVVGAVGVLRDLGADVSEVSLPLVPRAGAAFMAICDSEGAGLHLPWLRTRPADYDEGTRRRLLAAGLLAAALVHKAQQARGLIRRQLLDALATHDVLVAPTAHRPAPAIASATTPIASRAEAATRFFTRRSFTTPAALAGVPALAVPCGFSASGLPLSLQIIGRRFADATVLRVGHAYEQATDWHRRRPAI
jgi:choline dehydrogenase-like flavoprotein